MDRRRAIFLWVMALGASLLMHDMIFGSEIAHAAWYGNRQSSILSQPNVLGDYDSNSVQDITYTNTGAATGWRMYDNRTKEPNGTWYDADRAVLEIAKLSIHYMQSVQVGVYITPEVYNSTAAMNALTLKYISLGCRTNNTSGQTSYDVADVSRMDIASLYLIKGDGTDATAVRTYTNKNICDSSNFHSGNTQSLGLASYKDKFIFDNDTQLYKLIAKLGYLAGPYGNSTYIVLGSINFQIQLGDGCAALPEGTDAEREAKQKCRAYVAMIKADTRDAAKTQPAGRNYALGGQGFNASKDTANNRFIRQYFEFALKCTDNAAVQNSINLYDINDGTFVLGKNGLIGVVLQQYDSTTGTWTNIGGLGSDVTVANYNSSGSLINNNGVRSVSNGLGRDVNRDNLNNRYLYSLWNDQSISRLIVPIRQDKTVTRITFTMQPDVRYRVAITPDFINNFVAVGLPGDSIFGLVGCYSYSLQPRVTGDNTVPANSTATFNNFIDSQSDSLTHARDIEWRSFGFITRDGSTPSRQGEYDNLNSICSNLNDCRQIGSGTNVTVQAARTETLSSTSYATSSLHYGDKVCSFLAISPYQTDAPRAWRVSATKCITITKTPRLQVWGGDARVGSKFVGGGTNVVSLIGANRGSWGEYGVLAAGAVAGFGSGALWSGGSLTFANTPTPTQGSFTTLASIAGLGTIPDVKTYLEKAGDGENHTKTGVTVLPAPATIDGYTGNRVYTTSGTVTITGNIINDSTGSSLSQMVIIANNILIQPGVRQIDAWLIATGTLGAINTCSAAGNPTADNCGTQLVINGPVMAKQLLLRRTGGDDANQNSPAETVNLRGDAYIWVHKLSELTGTVRTVYTRELAPRY